MSNCYSSQAEYDDHDFIEGICKDCGEVSKRDVTALAGQVKMLESKVTELVERNRKLANQIVGHGDRMQQTIAGIVKTAKVEALREAAADLTEVVDGIQSSGSPNPLTWQTGALAMRDLLKSRADNLDKP